jgi:hypothetical protein
VTCDTELSLSTCHYYFTQSGIQSLWARPCSHPECMCPGLLLWRSRCGVGHQQYTASRAALAPTQWRALPVHCTVLTLQLIVRCAALLIVQMYKISHVHLQCALHCTALFSIAACVLQIVPSTALHCSAFQSVCCVVQLLPCSALWCS